MKNPNSSSPATPSSSTKEHIVDKPKTELLSAKEQGDASGVHDWEIIRPVRPKGEEARSQQQEQEELNHSQVVTSTTAARNDETNNSSITPDQVARYRHENLDGSITVAQNACQRHSLYSLTMTRELLQTNDFTFNTVLKPDMAATDQHDSGRCWLFATLNVCRIEAANKWHLGDDFEFSEAYLHFWDKLEKANAFLEAMLTTLRHADLDDRTLQLCLDDPIEDGGDWTPAVSLIRKYGLVPKFAFPESYTSRHTDDMNDTLEYLLRTTAQELRQIDCMEQARQHKNRRLAQVWKILCIHLGTPPTSFDWQWRDADDGSFHRQGSLTPLQFAQQIMDLDQLATQVCLIHDPRHDYYQTYTVDLSQTVLGGLDILYLNVPLDEMKQINQKMLQAGKPVWFACNVGQEFTERPGLWDANLYDLESWYGIGQFGMSKADRLRYGYPMGTHAMLMTGVDVLAENDTPRRWKVENSWGTEGGHDGYYTMNDNWYDEYVFEIVAPPDFLTDDMKEGLKKEPVKLPAWDVMCPHRRRRRL